MQTKLNSEIRELDIEIHDPKRELPDLVLSTGRSSIAVQKLRVRYLNVGTQQNSIWLVASIDVHGKIRSKVTGGLTGKSSKVEYCDPEKECPRLMKIAEEHAPGKLWHLHR